METALCLLYRYYISNMALGFCFGFLTIPFALLHMLVFSKK